MEFNEKLQELRKSRGLTQDELADMLYVSRTAISKWETGRGYPSLDSLKAIAEFFSVTVDELLSGEEILTVAKEESRQNQSSICNLVFSLLDISVAMLLFLPFFGQESEGTVSAVSLLTLSDSEVYLKVFYFILTIGIVVFGAAELVFRNCGMPFLQKNGKLISLVLNAAGTLLFIISPQPYAAAFLFMLLIIKALIFNKLR